MSVVVIVLSSWPFRHYRGCGLLVCPRGTENDEIGTRGGNRRRGTPETTRGVSQYLQLSSLLVAGGRRATMGSLSIWHWLIVGMFVMIGMFVAMGMARRKGNSIKKLDEEAIRSGLWRCPFCAEFVRPEAIVCKHCGRDIQPE